MGEGAEHIPCCKRMTVEDKSNTKNFHRKSSHAIAFQTSASTRALAPTRNSMCRFLERTSGALIGEGEGDEM